MNGQDRRAAIVRAVLPVFAKQGFAETTTKQLAEVAGVSEALLYKHFPSKESLYAEIKNLGCQGGDPALEKIASLEPSTSTLVHIVYFLMRSLAVGRSGDLTGWDTRHRLVLNSCLEDGEFTRYLFKSHFGCCAGKLEACLDVAQTAGDLVASPVGKRNRLLFAHHLACMIAIMHLPEKPVIDYEALREELLDEAVWFALRGMGLAERAITVYYNPKALALFLGIG
jgi:AcrR family transcriptional regulator